VDASNEAGGGQTAGFSAARRGIAEAAGSLGGLTLLSRITGLLRDVVIAAFFGAGSGADAFFVAFRIPNLFRRIVAEGAASAAFVPVFTERLIRGGRQAALGAAGAVGSVSFALLTAITVAGVVWADELVGLLSPGFGSEPGKLALAGRLTAMMFPYLVLVGSAAWAMGTLHTFRRFTAPALGPILLNLSIICAAALIAPRLAVPVYGLAVGVLAGGILQVLVQVPSLGAEGLRPSMLAGSGDGAVGRVGALLVPTLFGGAVYQLSVLVATLFASLLPAGSVSWLWYADRLFEFPLGIVAVAVGTAALPTLARQAKSGRVEEMADSLGYSLRLVWSLALPAAVALWMLAPLVVSALFERGSFGSSDAEMTTLALRAYTPGLLAVASVRVLVAPFYALERPRIPVIVATVALGANVLFDLALMGPTDPGAAWWGAAWVARAGDALRVADMRHAGLAAGTAMAATLNAVCLYLLVRRHLPLAASGRLGQCFLRHGTATAVMALSLWLWGLGADRLLGGVPVYFELGGAVALGGLVYLVAGRALGSSELGDLFSVLGRSSRD
jgi:putative peptidoglycan lipid II flippase